MIEVLILFFQMLTVLFLYLAWRSMQENKKTEVRD